MDEILEKRRKIDKIDLNILALLAKRERIASEIGCRKRKTKMFIKDTAREKEAMRIRISNARKYNLSVIFVKKLFSLIFKQSRIVQENVQRSSF